MSTPRNSEATDYQQASEAPDFPNWLDILLGTLLKFQYCPFPSKEKNITFIPCLEMQMFVELQDLKGVQELLEQGRQQLPFIPIQANHMNKIVACLWEGDETQVYGFLERPYPSHPFQRTCIKLIKKALKSKSRTRAAIEGLLQRLQGEEDSCVLVREFAAANALFHYNIVDAIYWLDKLQLSIPEEHSAMDVVRVVLAHCYRKADNEIMCWEIVLQVDETMLTAACKAMMQDLSRYLRLR